MMNTNFLASMNPYLRRMTPTAMPPQVGQIPPSVPRLPMNPPQQAVPPQFNPAGAPVQAIAPGGSMVPTAVPPQYQGPNYNALSMLRRQMPNMPLVSSN